MFNFQESLIFIFVTRKYFSLPQHTRQSRTTAFWFFHSMMWRRIKFEYVNRDRQDEPAMSVDRPQLLSRMKKKKLNKIVENAKWKSSIISSSPRFEWSSRRCNFIQNKSMFYWSISTHWINAFPMKFICLNLFYGLGHSFKLYIRFVCSLRLSLGVKIETNENRKRESIACDYQQHPFQQIVFSSLFLPLCLTQRMFIVHSNDKCKCPQNTSI